MNDFLFHLIRRSWRPEGQVRPRLGSLFEPSPPTGPAPSDASEGRVKTGPRKDEVPETVQPQPEGLESPGPVEGRVSAQSARSAAWPDSQAMCSGHETARATHEFNLRGGSHEIRDRRTMSERSEISPAAPHHLALQGPAKETPSGGAGPWGFLFQPEPVIDPGDEGKDGSQPPGAPMPGMPPKPAPGRHGSLVARPQAPIITASAQPRTVHENAADVGTPRQARVHANEVSQVRPELLVPDLEGTLAISPSSITVLPPTRERPPNTLIQGESGPSAPGATPVKPLSRLPADGEAWSVAQPRVPAQPETEEMAEGKTPLVPTVRVSIGRIEVRAEVPDNSRPRHEAHRKPIRRPALSLADYLRKRGNSS